jgi:quercetin dioxygenase-like cupin family protein
VRTRSLTGAVLFVLIGVLLAGCAQPGQLGHPDDDHAAAPAGDSAPAGGPSGGPGEPSGVPGVPAVPAAQAGSDARGSLERPIEIGTPGPSELLVRTEVLQPGQVTGWIRHPGTAVSAVRSGTVTVQRAGRCEPQTFGAGQAFFVGDGEPNELRNDGPEPAVLTRSELLAPGIPEREPTDPAC